MTGILIAMTAVVLLALCLLGRWQRSRRKNILAFMTGFILLESALAIIVLTILKE